MITLSLPIPDSYQPQIRSEIIFGPPELSRGVTVYYIKDAMTNWFYRIGAKEFFILSRMDGSRTLQQIGEEYHAQFGRRLNEQAWQGLFKLLAARQLLVGSSEMSLALLKKEAAKRKKADERGLLRWRLSLVNPDAFLEKLLPRLRFAFHPLFVLPALAAIVALEIFVLLNRGTILADVLASTDKRVIVPVIASFIMVSWVIAAFHETAHGLTCKRFGGSVHEMGIMWRYLSLFPYCKIDDIVLFHNRWHRVYAAFAGTFMSFLMLVPFGVFWAFSPEKSILRDVSALLLVVLNIQCFINFVPFIELDGYFMLSHALDMIDLRKESHQFCLKGVKKLLLHKGEGTSDYARHRKNVYLIYGLVSIIFTVYFVTYMTFYWVDLAKQWLGPTAAWDLPATFALLFILFKWPGAKTIWAWCKKTVKVKVPTGANT